MILPPEVTPVLCTLIGASYASAVSAFRLAKWLRATTPARPSPAPTLRADGREAAPA
jgi:hypothetical protein